MWIVKNSENKPPAILQGQGNSFSSYKHANTSKCLIAVTPNGGACFVSDLFEGDISDVEIFEESGILKHIEPYDVILADRGFPVQHQVNPLQRNIPAKKASVYKPHIQGLPNME